MSLDEKTQRLLAMVRPVVDREARVEASYDKTNHQGTLMRDLVKEIDRRLDGTSYQVVSKVGQDS